jgi:hypothetical protein
MMAPQLLKIMNIDRNKKNITLYWGWKYLISNNEKRVQDLFTHIILRNSTDFIKYKYTIFKNDFWSIGNQLLV